MSAPPHTLQSEEFKSDASWRRAGCPARRLRITGRSGGPASGCDDHRHRTAALPSLSSADRHSRTRGFRSIESRCAPRGAISQDSRQKQRPGAAKQPAGRHAWSPRVSVSWQRALQKFSVGSSAVEICFRGRVLPASWRLASVRVRSFPAWTLQHGRGPSSKASIGSATNSPSKGRPPQSSQGKRGQSSSSSATEERDETYRLVSVLYHALQGAENYTQYAEDARRSPSRSGGSHGCVRPLRWHVHAFFALPGDELRAHRSARRHL